MCPPYCLQAVVSDEQDAEGLPTLNPQTSQRSLMSAFHFGLFSNARLNLLRAEIWGLRQEVDCSASETFSDCVVMKPADFLDSVNF